MYNWIVRVHSMYFFWDIFSPVNVDRVEFKKIFFFLSSLDML